MRHKTFPIFISYRHSDTADKAEHLLTLLEESGYKGLVSFDRENLDGRFDLEILWRLDHCKDFIVILGTHTMDSLKVEDAFWYQRLGFLALSGANVPGQPDGNDGLVRASDVAKMNLRNCDLAMLSACQTGVGGLGEDGVFGLQRGFKNAGVHSLLMSLKPVYDESTAQLMVAFYEGLAGGMSKREALLEAQKRLRADEKFAKGEHWAPFILLDGVE